MLGDGFFLFYEMDVRWWRIQGFKASASIFWDGLDGFWDLWSLDDFILP